MSGRLMMVLGIAAIGVALGIIGRVEPASADLLFGGESTVASSHRGEPAIQRVARIFLASPLRTGRRQ
jgi:hypothetical protein